MGLNTNYLPKVVVETSGMSNDEWLNWRKNGIGGSDVATLFGDSHFKNNADIYYNKINEPTKIKASESNWFILQYGHTNEELVAQQFQKKTGIKVFNDTVMYCHPFFPFMQANLDRYAYIGKEKVIVEIKTTNSNNKKEWGTDEDPKIPVGYVWQARHYMAVMNLNTVIFVCLAGNTENDIILRKLSRNLDIEETLIKTEQLFWEENVQKQIPPKMIGPAKLKINTIKMYGGYANSELPNIVDISPKAQSLVDKYLAKRKECTEINRIFNNTKAQIDDIKKLIQEYIGDEPAVKFSYKENEVVITNKPSMVKTINPHLLETFPELEQEQEESRLFYLKKEKSSSKK